MKSRMQGMKWMLLCTVVILLLAGTVSLKAQAADFTATAKTDRKAGTCTYTVGGLDITKDTQLTLRVNRSDNKKLAWERVVTLTEENVKEGTLTDTFSLSDVNYDYTSYSVNIVMGDQTVKAGVCDFSIHQSKIRLSVSGESGAKKRIFRMNSIEPAGGVLAPGSGNQVSIWAWKKGKSESSAMKIGSGKTIAGESLTWSLDVTKAGKAYGSWYSKVVLSNSHWSAGKTISQAEYTVEPSVTSFAIKKSNALEKKKSFEIDLKGLKNAYGIKKVSFQLYNSKGKKVHTVTAKKKSSTYYAIVKLKSLKNKLEQYTVKAVIKDSANASYVLEKTAKADLCAKGGKLKVIKGKDATTSFQLTGAYLPGNIKKVQFVVYKNKKKKQGTYLAKLKKAAGKYTAKIESESTGKYSVYAYGYTTWGKKILLNRKNYQLSKKNMGKQGWHYEKYNGKKYKFYYINNQKQTDLTKILKLKKNSGKRFTIEVNRLAGVVTIYMYNTDTKKYDIPVKTCTVSVGRDVSTVAGTGGLNLDSSYTPIGTYSICSNGMAVRYPLKPMHEPDGSTVYARWCTHIVGNVYFHAIAVGTQSHYALSASTYNRLGTPASAGCIRMTVADAKWLYDYMPTGTPVKVVQGSSSKPGPLGKEKTIQVQGSINYDPTDPEVPDSRKKKDYKAKRISGYMTKGGKKVGY